MKFELINRVFEFNKSNRKKYGMMISSRICLELDELKEIYEDLFEEISTLELKCLPCQTNNTKHRSIMYIPQIGYQLCLSGLKLDDSELENLKDTEFAFAGEMDHQESYFYCTSMTKELDLLLGDVYDKILDMERSIIRYLDLQL